MIHSFFKKGTLSNSDTSRSNYNGRPVSLASPETIEFYQTPKVYGGFSEDTHACTSSFRSLPADISPHWSAEA